MNWREFPLFKIFPAFLLGILFTARIIPEAYPPEFFLVLLGVALCSVLTGMAGVFVRRSTWPYFCWFQAAFFLLGAWRYSAVAGERVSGRLSGIAGKATQVLAAVEEVRQGVSVHKVTARVYAVTDTTGDAVPMEGKVMLLLEKRTGSVPVAGNIVSVRGRLVEIGNNPNPGVFNYAAYLRGKRIYWQVYARSGDWAVYRRELAAGPGRWLQRCRRYCLDRLGTVLPGGTEYAIGAALLLGNREKMDAEVRDIFSHTGAMHILAVSGLHVGMIAWCLGRLLQWVPVRSRWAKGAVQVIGIWGYALLCGLGASVVRAALMFSWFTLGRVLDRPVNIWNALGGAAFFLLLIEPLWIFDIGFQLSFMAVAGIVLFEPPIYRALYVRNRLLDYLWKLTAVGLAAQLATAPLGIYYFHQFPLLFWLSGWVAVPLGALCQALGALYIILAQVPVIGPGAGCLLNLAIKAMYWGIYWIDQIPGACIKGLWLSEWGAWCACFCLGITAWAFFLSDKRAVWVGAMLLFFAGILELCAGLRISQRSEVICFGIKNASALEYLNGRAATGFYFGDSGRIAAQTEGFHLRGRVRSPAQLLITDTLINRQAGVLQRGPMAVFEATRFFVWDGRDSCRRTPPPGADYWLLRNSPFVPAGMPTDRFPRRAVVIDGSNSARSVRFYRRYFGSRGVKVHYTQTDGVWHLKLKPREDATQVDKPRLFFSG
ncbi:MAG: ComEC/Rec2 family competence protein [Saprospiraceae bacterium]